MITLPVIVEKTSYGVVKDRTLSIQALAGILYSEVLVAILYILKMVAMLFGLVDVKMVPNLS